MDVYTPAVNISIYRQVHLDSDTFIQASIITVIEQFTEKQFHGCLNIEERNSWWSEAYHITRQTCYGSGLYGCGGSGSRFIDVVTANRSSRMNCDV